MRLTHFQFKSSASAWATTSRVASLRLGRVRERDARHTAPTLIEPATPWNGVLPYSHRTLRTMSR